MKIYFEVLELVERSFENFFDMEDIELEKGVNFSFEKDFLGTLITVGELTEKNRKLQNEYFQPFLNEDVRKVDWMIKPEIIPFLHEIGHIFYYEDSDFETDALLKEAIKTQYNEGSLTYKEHYKAYREIACEKLADQFAVDFINKHYMELAAICQNTTVENIELFVA